MKSYKLEIWINNVGFGYYSSAVEQSLEKIESMIHLNIEALTLFSTLFVHDYKNIERTQLINISSCGGYTIVPTAIIYCATKFCVSAFTEGLASEQIADFLIYLYDSDKVVGAVNRETFQFKMFESLFDYAGNSSHNQKL